MLFEKHHTSFRPLIVGVGGTTRAGSSSEKALTLALSYAQRQGADVELFTGTSINLPMYSPETPTRTDEAKRFICALRRANGVILASPGYHGSISGLIKNALDYTEDMRNDELPYLEGRAVGLIACAFGWQATGSTTNALRSIIHALRGWPTPLAVAINTAGTPFSNDGVPTASEVGTQLSILARHVVEFAQMRALRELGRQEATMEVPP
jgi:FMN reductase